MGAAVSSRVLKYGWRGVVTRQTTVVDDFFCTQSRRPLFGPEDSPLVVRNDELGSRIIAIDERRRTHAALFHSLVVFFQDERVVVVPRSAVYFGIIAALPLHDETS